ncbi:uncharacterized protein STEHIDRAFT_59118, partial [Stereum hirsutum FP-91666 SS1]|uniref:uncharacterized protein n=1 Tax=Stereum hirsutum (strain FP-91666) TaxID=721885 RepID=UPI000440F45A
MSDDKRAVDKLNRHNYSSWVDNAEAVLGSKGVWGQVDGTDIAPTPPNASAMTASEAKEMREWNQRKAKASGEIWLLVEENQKAHIRKEKGDPKAMWEKLESVFVQKKTGTRFDAYSELFSTRLQEGESLSDLVARVDLYISHIKERRPAKFSLDDLDSELSSMTLIKALPSDYNNFVTFLTLSDDLSLDNVTQAFSNEEQSRKRRALQ